MRLGIVFVMALLSRCRRVTTFRVAALDEDLMVSQGSRRYGGREGVVNEGFDYRYRIDDTAAGERLVDFLGRRYRHTSATDWRTRIESGHVLVDTVAAAPDTVLRRGQTVVWCRPPWREPAAPTAFALLLDDADVLAVAKPAGLPTLPGGGFLENTLLHRVRAFDPAAAPLHRLGRWTSGVVLFARSAHARSELSRQWAAREIEKRYRALASGRPEWDERRIDLPIGPVPHPLLGSVHAASPEGKPASTRVVVVERRDGAFLCDVRIPTGRPHQIRIHLAAAGHPLAGDPLYRSGGIPAPASRALPGDPGYLLHAAELTFRHPGTGRAVRVGCSPPPPLRVASAAAPETRWDATDPSIR
jgi:23S rRNA pseudouridine1911/1915/1917 synthase